MTDTVSSLLNQLDENYAAVRHCLAVSNVVEQSESKDDYSDLLGLIYQRDNLVQKLLEILPSEQCQQFAQSQLSLHQQIQQQTNKLFEEIEQQLADFMRSKKAVGRYK